MKIKVTCDFCKVTIAVPAEKAGKKVRCPKCQEIISIPEPEQSSTPPQKARRPASLQQTSESESRASRVRSAGGSRQSESPANRSPAPRKRKKKPAEDDIWSQPLSSYSSPAIEEHEYELYGIEPRQRVGRNEGHYAPNRANRELGTHNSYTPPNYKIPLIMAAIGLGSALVLGGIGFAVPAAGIAGAGIGGVIGFLLMLWGGLKIMSNAFEDSFLTGFLYMSCGPYAFYFIISRWDVNQHPFIVNLLGTLVFFVSVGISAIAAGGN